MNKNASVLLVLGIAAILIIVVMSKPKKASNTTQSSAGYFNQLFALGGAVANSFGQGTVRPPAMVTSTDTSSQAGYALGHDVVDQEGNQLVDLNTGNALVYGAE